MERIMRLTAYKRILASANELPNELEGNTFFNKPIYNPRTEAMNKVLDEARVDRDLTYYQLVRL